MMLLPQLAHLRGVDAEVGEHAPLCSDVSEATLRIRSRQSFHELGTQALDTVAHSRQLLDPGAPQLLLREDFVNDRRAVIGWHRIDAAGDANQLAERRIRRAR